jgi:outer membrane protein OmpA-like peptidoglycan-associated protein
VSNLGVSAEKVSSVGYGEAKPVANNETESGRTRNRRIDVVMDLGVTQ